MSEMYPVCATDQQTGATGPRYIIVLGTRVPEVIDYD
jgi:hypothetical protein